MTLNDMGEENTGEINWKNQMRSEQAYGKRQGAETKTSRKFLQPVPHIISCKSDSGTANRQDAKV